MTSAREAGAPETSIARQLRYPLRLLGVFFVLLSSVMAGGIAATPTPAQADTLTVTATTSQRWNPFSPNPPITIAGTTVTDGVKTIRVSLDESMAGFAFQPWGSCPVDVVLTGLGEQCYASGRLWIRDSQESDIPAGTAFSITIAAGTFNSGNLSNRSVTVETFNSTDVFNPGAVVDTGTTTLLFPPETVTFDANGGTGTMSPQSSSTAQPLTKNTFTRDDFEFGGWGFGATGTFVSYADEATYAFDQSITLFARWVATSTPTTTPDSGTTPDSSTTPSPTPTTTPDSSTTPSPDPATTPTTTPNSGTTPGPDGGSGGSADPAPGTGQLPSTGSNSTLTPWALLLMALGGLGTLLASGRRNLV